MFVCFPNRKSNCINIVVGDTSIRNCIILRKVLVQCGAVCDAEHACKCENELCAESKVAYCDYLPVREQRATGEVDGQNHVVP